MTEPLLSSAIEVALKAGALLIDYYNHSGTRARLKSDRTVVTEADLEADRMIAETLQEKFQGEAILSEELRSSLSGEIGEAVWVIDPLDGTTNFSLHLPFWGVSIARLVGGWPETGIIYFPVLNELYTASLGRGSQLNGGTLHAQPPNPDIPATFFSCCSRTYRHYQVDIKYKARILGSAAYSFCSVARGIALIAFEATPKMWDIAAAWLIVTESGGVVETYDGASPFPILPGKEYAQTSFPTLAAATPALLAKARQNITPKRMLTSQG